MESFKIVIDGKECEAFPGETVLEVAERNGIVIPVFCYHKELRPEGACRVCLVEVEGAPRLVTACTLKAMPDMVVKTNTERVRRARAGVIELILNNHTLECPICDKSGECELQMTGFRHGPKKSRYKEPRREKDVVIKGPLIEIDNDRCILCRRCIRMCGENMGNRVLGILNRGYKAYISPFNGDFVESGCEHCGSCVDVCPVGSLLDRAFKYKDRPWRMTKTWTTCSFCGSGCKLEVDTYHGKVKRVVGRIGVNDGHNRGYLCVRGKWGWDSIYSDKRLKEPLLREGSSYRKISLEEALEILRERVVGREVNLFVESSLTNEELSAVASVFGNVGTSDSLGFYDLLEGISSVRKGFDPLDSIYKADVIFVVGDFVEEITPVVATLLRLAVIQKGKRLIRLGSFPSKLDSVAFSSLKVPQWELLDAVKHLLVGIFDTSYSSNDKEIDSVAKSLRGKRVAFVLGGLLPYFVDAKEVGRSVAELAGKFDTSYVVPVPPKANSLGVVERFNLKRPSELNGEVNVIVNGELERDFFGVELPKGKFTVLFTPFYTPEIASADLVIPLETALEKRGTFTGISGQLTLDTALEPQYSLLELLSKLPVKEEREVKRRAELSSSVEGRGLAKERGKLILTVLPNRTGWNSLSYYSENVAKVAGKRELLLNPEDYAKEIVVLRTEGGELQVKAVKDPKVPKGHALLRVERFTRDISELLKGAFPALSGIKCEIAEE
ncbi:2Fe-2S iron-sulfur cluster-binding protein [Thermovibrio sp.]